MAVDMTEIKRNSDWYYANQDLLASKYDGKFIAIIDCTVISRAASSTPVIGSLLQS